METTLTLRIFQAADDAWQAALEAAYAKDAGDARYDARGKATPELAALADARDRAMFEWHRQCDNRRRVLSGYADSHRGY